MTQVVTALYDNYDSAVSAVNALEDAGSRIPRSYYIKKDMVRWKSGALVGQRQRRFVVSYISGDQKSPAERGWISLHSASVSCSSGNIESYQRSMSDGVL